MLTKGSHMITTQKYHKTLKTPSRKVGKQNRDDRTTFKRTTPSCRKLKVQPHEDPTQWETSHENENQTTQPSTKRSADEKKYTVFIRNLGYQTTEEEIKSVVNEVAKCKGISIVRDKETHQSKGYGFLQLYNEMDMETTIRKLNGYSLAGRSMFLECAIGRHIPITEKHLLKTKQKISQSKLKVASSLNQLDLKRSIKISFQPSLNLSPSSLTALISFLIPKRIVICTLYSMTPNASHDAIVDKPNDNKSPRKKVNAKNYSVCEEQINKDSVTEKWILEFPTIKDAIAVSALLNRLVIPPKAILCFTKGEKKIGDVKDVTVKAECMVNKEGPLQGIDCSTKSGPLIIRNISFKASKSDIFDVLKNVGVIKKFRLSEAPKSIDGEPKLEHGGYAFVIYKSSEDAKKAITELNKKPLKGRQIIIDWASAPELYGPMKDGVPKLPKPDFSQLEKGFSTQDIKDENSSNIDEDDMESEFCMSDIENETEMAKKQALKVLGLQDMNNLDEEDKERERENDGCDETEASENEEETQHNINGKLETNDIKTITQEKKDGTVKVKSTITKDIQCKDVHVDNETNKSKKPTKKSSDVEEEKTIHVRNIAYNATTDDVKLAFQKYGPIVYVRLLKAPDGTSRGTAFVKFQDRASVVKVLNDDLQVAERVSSLHRNEEKRKHRLEDLYDIPLEGLGIVIKGRNVRVCKAVSRDVLGSITEQKQSEKQNSLSKHMELMDIGYIAAGSKEANGMSKRDQKRRENIQKEKITKLNNPNYNINPLRLSIKNLPIGMPKETVHKAIIEFCSNDPEVQKFLVQKYPDLFKSLHSQQRVKKHLVKRAAEKCLTKFTICIDNTPNIIPATGKRNVSELAKSKGFGFATFTDHSVAVRVLKYLNNNPLICGDLQRPIVDFAVEDKRALKHHETLLLKLKNTQKNSISTLSETSNNVKKSKKRKLYSRGELYMCMIESAISFHPLCSGQQQRETKRQRKIEEQLVHS